jgi:hypothetical protein
MKSLIKSKLRYSLYAVLAAGFLFFGVYKYATNLREGIERKKEIQRLENEKLRLEIQILKKQCCC